MTQKTREIFLNFLSAIGAEAFVEHRFAGLAGETFEVILNSREALDYLTDELDKSVCRVFIESLKDAFMEAICGLDISDESVSKAAELLVSY